MATQAVGYSYEQRRGPVLDIGLEDVNFTPGNPVTVDQECILVV